MNKMNKNIDNQLKYLVMEILKSNGFSVEANRVIEKIKENGEAWKNVNGGKDFENKIKYMFKELNDKNIVKKVEDIASTWNKDGGNFEESFKEIVEQMANIYEFAFVIDEDEYIETETYKVNDFFNDDNEEDAKILSANDIDKLSKYLIEYNLQDKFTISNDDYDSL